MGESGDLVHLLLHRLAFNDVLEVHLSADLGQNRQGVRVPLHEQNAGIGANYFRAAQIMGPHMREMAEMRGFCAGNAPE